jgi:hypothetical protein
VFKTLYGDVTDVALPVVSVVTGMAGDRSSMSGSIGQAVQQST